MNYINLQNVSVELPVFTGRNRNLTSKLLGVATGGTLKTNGSGLISVKALNNINLTLEDGDRLGVLGWNGAGKSTLLRTLIGVFTPTSGNIQIEGSVGSLLDISLGIVPDATGRENIYYRGALMGIPKQLMNSYFEEIVEFSELGEFINMPVRTYSSGMHLRLAFSVSTVIRPDILVMDEWLSVGDEAFVHKAESRLQEIVSNSKIMVLASHSRSLIEATCNRAIWLDKGEIKMRGSVEEVTHSYFL